MDNPFPYNNTSESIYKNIYIYSYKSTYGIELLRTSIIKQKNNTVYDGNNRYIKLIFYIIAVKNISAAAASAASWLNRFLSLYAQSKKRPPWNLNVKHATLKKLYIHVGGSL